MSTTNRTRALLVILGACAAAAIFTFRASPTTPRARLARDAERVATPAPYRGRLYPRAFASSPAPARTPVVADEADAQQAAPTPRAADLDPRAPAQPPAPAQTATSWATSYRNAVCSCRTRGCVRDLQAGFVHAVGTMSYDDLRDGQAYAEASRAVVKCYSMLPESS